jgi:transposase
MKRNSSKTTIGLDLGDRKHAVCVLAGDGEVEQEGSVPNTREDLEELSASYGGALIVMEVGMQSPWVSRFFKEWGHRVLVANPRKVRAIYQNDRKSDRRDAEMLARLARSDEKLLSPVEHGSEQAQRDLLQIKLRDNLVRQRVDVISAVRFTLKSMGIRLRSPKTTCFARHARRALEEDHAELLAMIEPSLQVIDSMTAQIRELERAIERLANECYPETAFLQQIAGVGTITSLTFVLTIGDPLRFERARDAAAYLGLVPKRDQSGDTDKQLRISKAGDAYLRRLLVSAAQYILGPFGPDCRLKRKGLELAERGGPRAKKKAVVAVARKLTLLMLALWRDETIYKPLKRAA